MNEGFLEFCQVSVVVPVFLLSMKEILVIFKEEEQERGWLGVILLRRRIDPKLQRNILKGEVEKRQLDLT